MFKEVERGCFRVIFFNKNGKRIPNEGFLLEYRCDLMETWGDVRDTIRRVQRRSWSNCDISEFDLHKGDCWEPEDDDEKFDYDELFQRKGGYIYARKKTGPLPLVEDPPPERDFIDRFLDYAEAPFLYFFSCLRSVFAKILVVIFDQRHK